MAESLNTTETSQLIASNKVEGTAVFDRDGERLGSITNFMVDKRSGKAEYAVMQFGGFLGDLYRFDPREFPLIPGGGAGPIHGCLICTELEIPLQIVPREASTELPLPSRLLLPAALRLIVPSPFRPLTSDASNFASSPAIIKSGAPP